MKGAADGSGRGGNGGCGVGRLLLCSEDTADGDGSCPGFVRVDIGHGRTGARTVHITHALNVIRIALWGRSKHCCLREMSGQHLSLE